MDHWGGQPVVGHHIHHSLHLEVVGLQNLHFEEEEELQSLHPGMEVGLHILVLVAVGHQNHHPEVAPVELQIQVGVVGGLQTHHPEEAPVGHHIQIVPVGVHQKGCWHPQEGHQMGYWHLLVVQQEEEQQGGLQRDY